MYGRDVDCLYSLDLKNRVPDWELARKLVPSVCANMVGGYMEFESRSVCYQATHDDLQYKFEFYVVAPMYDPQHLHQETCEMYMKKITINANRGPGECDASTEHLI